MTPNDLKVNFPGFLSGATLQCSEDGSLKLRCDLDNGKPWLPVDTFTCCHLSVKVENDRKKCRYKDDGTCTIHLTVDECSRPLFVHALPTTDTLDASTAITATRQINGK